MRYRRVERRSGQWQSALGTPWPAPSLVVVDDADHTEPDALRYLTEHAAATNTKLLLITSTDNRQPTHTLIDVLATDLPWAQHVGIPPPHHQRTATALDRAADHLTITGGTRDEHHQQVAELLQRRNQLINHYSDPTRDLSTDRVPSTNGDLGSGLGL